MIRQLSVAVAATCLCIEPASAHGGTGVPGGFEYGLIHPLIGLDHVLAMVSVGLWGAFLGRPLVCLLPTLFPLVMVLGAALGMYHVVLPAPELGIALSVLVLGGSVALAWRAPVWAASLLVSFFAIFHGYAHGVELPSAADPVGYSVGFVLATGLLHVAGISLGLLNIRPRGVWITRTCGMFVGVAGMWLLVRGGVA